jgi:hypothetical protein
VLVGLHETQNNANLEESEQFLHEMKGGALFRVATLEGKVLSFAAHPHDSTGEADTQP